MFKENMKEYERKVKVSNDNDKLSLGHTVLCEMGSDLAIALGGTVMGGQPRGARGRGRGCGTSGRRCRTYAEPVKSTDDSPMIPFHIRHVSRVSCLKSIFPFMRYIPRLPRTAIYSPPRLHQCTDSTLPLHSLILGRYTHSLRYRRFL